MQIARRGIETEQARANKQPGSHASALAAQLPGKLPAASIANPPPPHTSFSARSLSTWPVLRKMTKRLLPLRARPVTGHTKRAVPSVEPSPAAGSPPGAASSFSSVTCFRLPMWPRDLGIDLLSRACVDRLGSDVRS
jgi:hypothetical protein